MNARALSAQFWIATLSSNEQIDAEGTRFAGTFDAGVAAPEVGKVTFECTLERRFGGLIVRAATDVHAD
jgi:hypothetical protein